MRNKKPVKIVISSRGTTMGTSKAAASKVVVQASMDALTRTSTGALQKEMAEAIKRDIKLLKKYGLATG